MSAINDTTANKEAEEKKSNDEVKKVGEPKEGAKEIKVAEVSAGAEESKVDQAIGAAGDEPAKEVTTANGNDSPANGTGAPANGTGAPANGKEADEQTEEVGKDEAKPATNGAPASNGVTNGAALLDLVDAAREVSDAGGGDVAVVVIPKDQDKPVVTYATGDVDAPTLIEQTKGKRSRNVDEEGHSVDPALAPTQPKHMKS